MALQFNNRFIENLPADEEHNNYVRQVYHACYSLVEPLSVKQPQCLLFNKDLAVKLGAEPGQINSNFFADYFSGKNLLEGMQPYAMCYGGHQFGNWAGQLGDGRAINLGEVKTKSGNQALQLKGAGMTPYSRHADGLAVLRSSIREYLCSEAMFHLNVPTTRALSLVLTGNQVERDMFYDGRPEMEPGAIVCRVSSSFIRFGSFEIFAARQDIENLRQLLDYCIQYDYPELKATADDIYVQWFAEVARRTCEMIVHWQRVGFVHGVMNTDNMSILGLTIDYGPYGWLDNFDPNWTPNTTDLPGRRYCFANQPKISHWNLYKLAQAVAKLLDESQVEKLEVILNTYPQQYEEKFLQMMAQKLGLSREQIDMEFIQELETLMSQMESDMTLFYRRLIDFTGGESAAFFADTSYHSRLSDEVQNKFNQWLNLYSQKVAASGVSQSQRQDMMAAVNPVFVLRNYLAQQAIDAAEQGDYDMLNDLVEALKKPYEHSKTFNQFIAKRPDWAKTKAGCSMLSCSS